MKMEISFQFEKSQIVKILRKRDLSGLCGSEKFPLQTYLQTTAIKTYQRPVL